LEYKINYTFQYLFKKTISTYILQAKAKNEKTTVTMPPALIEGTETVIFFTLFILYHEQAVRIYLKTII
jgi:hypothetical protein